MNGYVKSHHPLARGLELALSARTAAPGIHTRSTACASRLIQRVDSGLPISSSELTSSTGVSAGCRPKACSACRAATISTSPPFMSNTPGPRRMLPSRSDRHPVERARRPHRVAMAQQRLCGPATYSPHGPGERTLRRSRGHASGARQSRAG